MNSFRNLKLNTNQAAIISSIVVGSLIIAIVFWLAFKPQPQADEQYRYQGEGFSMRVPKAATVDVRANRVAFTVGAAGQSNGDLSEVLKDVSGTFGLQVYCSERQKEADIIAEVDAEYQKSQRIDGREVTAYTKTTINNLPARILEYENSVHQIMVATVQDVKKVCLVSAYIPKDNPQKWRAVATSSIRSLMIVN